jgi:hypothetical protein|tara:strand:+ start:980 stop:1258 length:279 start_codon:yes stop_codon:yes gene_type:complete
MSEYIPKPGTGTLWKNKYKTDDRHPGMKGYIIAHRDIREGEKVEVAAWTKDGPEGKFQSLQISDVYVKDGASNPPAENENPAGGMDDEIPPF